MVVMILERVTPSLRGELTRWLIQPKTGVFVGLLPARVRDLLWVRIEKSATIGAATMIYSNNTEQGFSFRSIGDTSKAIEDFDGLLLAKTPEKA
jgi:CRISPR-associated protein Cas2